MNRLRMATLSAAAVSLAVAGSALAQVRALSGGTLERTYEDGKKQKVTYKTGEVHVNEPGPTYSTKNIGGKEIKLYTVQVK